MNIIMHILASIIKIQKSKFEMPYVSYCQSFVANARKSFAEKKEAISIIYAENNSYIYRKMMKAHGKIHL